MSAEMATSPASLDPLRDSEAGKVDGNDSTSVALSWLRNCRFSARTAALLVTSTFTVPRRPTAFRARNTKRSSMSWFNPATCFSRITKLFSTTFSLQHAAQNQTGGPEPRPSHPTCTALSLRFGGRRLLLVHSRFVRSRCRLLFGARRVSMPGLGQQQRLLLGHARLV